MVAWFAVSGGWPERENVHANRLQEVLDMYKAIILAEKQQREKDKKKQRRPFVSYTVSSHVLFKSISTVFECLGKNWSIGSNFEETDWTARGPTFENKTKGT